MIRNFQQHYKKIWKYFNKSIFLWIILKHLLIGDSIGNSSGCTVGESRFVTSDTGSESVDVVGNIIYNSVESSRVSVSIRTFNNTRSVGVFLSLPLGSKFISYVECETVWIRLFIDKTSCYDTTGWDCSELSFTDDDEESESEDCLKNHISI
jgi:hypothetical protein